ncbi:efflux RND transporter periplasmic adaptor subunit [Streptococcus ovuberis]|uniref:Efflux RND transporter periplasmic adaptor subunit n=1 Tax=Streptococcus ovuberis TaxID=1936207 RepID=A0A7X6S1Q5_9STRE|nr:efflux RND transporter periplasmic adaptor subunit [Streptococcus ovuberis]NKZ21047.1 efflux RND transporter periplasmic adaptor subunit [Streptococcus ovuberis]
MFRGKSKAFKGLVIGLGSLVVVSLVAMLGLGFLGGNKAETVDEMSYTIAEAKEGQLTSSTLLTGTVKANEEQYVYYDAAKGDIANIAVKVGDQVQVGQVLFSYDGKEAQMAYDAAVRALNKIDRQIYELNTYGVTVTETGDEETDQQATATAQRSVNSQMSDLQDSRADAVDGINKAQVALDEAQVKSTVAGTVVEVNRSVAKSTTGSAQTVIHIVNNSSLVVAGEMSEYNLANIKVDQEVSMTSKVYPDKTWTGKVSYISDYPSSAGGSDSSTTAAGGSNAKYPFKVQLTSDLAELKQGFTVSIQVNNNQKGLIVPVGAVLTDDETTYYVYTYDKTSHKIKRTVVEIGSADGANQQILSGLKAGDKVIENPTMDLTDGQEVTVDEQATN